MSRFATVGAAAAVGLLGTAPLPAAVSSTAFGVTVTVAPNCSIDPDAGRAPPSVSCSSAAPYTVETAAVPASSLGPAARQQDSLSSPTVVLVTIAY